METWRKAPQNPCSFQVNPGDVTGLVQSYGHVIQKAEVCSVDRGGSCQIPILLYSQDENILLFYSQDSNNINSNI